MENNATSDTVSLSDLEPAFPGVADSRVHKDPSGADELVWPVLLLYPEYKITEFIQHCAESSVLKDHLVQMFATPPEWDKDQTYKLEDLNLYYEGTKKFTLFKVDINKTLLEIMKEDYFELRAGTPSFIVLVKDSKVEKSFLRSCS